MSRKSLLVAVLACFVLVAVPASSLGAGPTAIAVDADGYAYAGYGAGGRIDRWQPGNGGMVGQFQIAGSPAVAGIDAVGEDLWILDTTNTIRRISKYGNPLQTVSLGGCTTAGDALARGGIDVSGATVWVASACSDKVHKLTTAGAQQGSFDVIQPRGIAVQGDRVSVGRRTTGDVAQYDINDFSLKRTQPVGGKPGGVFVDAYRVIFASDVDNHYVRQFGEDGAEFRTLGRFGANPGDLNVPADIDVFGQYGGDLAGNIFIADYANKRIQRWNSYGYTFWTAAADDGQGGGGPTPQPPASSSPPQISGTPQQGQTVSCSQGAWTNSPTGHAYQWRRDGSDIGGAAASSYALTAADVGRQITCAVTASNSAGSATAVSSAITPTAISQPPSRVGVSINNKARFTNSRNVEVWVTPPVGATTVLISTDGDFAGVLTPGSLCCSNRYPVVLPDQPNERLPVTAYVRFEGPGIDPDQTYTDDIVLDQTAPAVTSATATRSGSVTSLRLRATDTTSGVQSIEVRNAGGGATTVMPYKRALKVKRMRARKVRVRAVDRAGNRGRWKIVRVRRR